jgi:hypothetical protein
LPVDYLQQKREQEAKKSEPKKSFKLFDKTMERNQHRVWLKSQSLATNDISQFDQAMKDNCNPDGSVEPFSGQWSKRKRIIDESVNEKRLKIQGQENIHSKCKSEDHLTTEVRSEGEEDGVKPYSGRWAKVKLS